MDDRNIGKAFVAELIGTFLLVFSIVGAVTLYGGTLADAQTPLPNIVIPFVALAHGFALFIGIMSLGAVSGGHFNPAVTVGLLSIKKISSRHAGVYVIAQVLGALIATFLLALVLNKQGQSVNFGQAKLAPGISTGAGIVLEAMFVFFLVWTIVATAVNPKATKEWAPAAIATSLALGVLLIGQWTGAALNPARAFAPDLTNALFGADGSGGFGSFLDFLLVYLIAPLAAGVLAASVYKSLYLESEPRPRPARAAASDDDEPLGPPE